MRFWVCRFCLGRSYENQTACRHCLRERRELREEIDVPATEACA